MCDICGLCSTWSFSCIQGTRPFMVVRTCPPEPPHLFRKWSRSRPAAYRMGRMNRDLQLGWEWIGIVKQDELLSIKSRTSWSWNNLHRGKRPLAQNRISWCFANSIHSQERWCLWHEIECWLVLSKLTWYHLIPCSPCWYGSKWLDHIGPPKWVVQLCPVWTHTPLECAGLPKSTTILQLFIGSTMAMVAGTLFGNTFVLLGFDECSSSRNSPSHGSLGGICPRLPTDLVQGDFGKQHSRSIMDYVFSHFIGIFLMAVFALVCYVPWS